MQNFNSSNLESGIQGHARMGDGGAEAIAKGLNRGPKAIVWLQLQVFLAAVVLRMNGEKERENHRKNPTVYGFGGPETKDEAGNSS